METTPSQPESLIETLIDWRNVLWKLVEDLKILRNFSEALKLEKSLPLIDNTLERIKKQCFSVGVVGVFKSGKSTFINALLGQEILPTDVLPTTATLNRLTFGLDKRVEVKFKDETLQEVAIDRLKEFVTKLNKESAKMASLVKEAVIYFPVPYCENHVDIIDTPGLNDEDTMTEVTLSVLPQMDAAILVINAIQPFSDFEREFLETRLITTDLGRIIFLANGIDRLNNPEDADRVIEHIRERIQTHVMQRAQDRYGSNSSEYETYLRKIGTPRVYGISALQALKSKSQGDSTLLVQSRFPEFVKVLEKLLTQERGVIFIQEPINRIISSASEILQTIELQKNALEMDKNGFMVAYDRSMQEIKSLTKKREEELKLIDKAAAAVKDQTQILLNNLEGDLKEAAKQAILAAPITPDDFKDFEALRKQMSRQVTESVHKAALKLSEEIQEVVSSGLASEVSRLEGLCQEVDRTLQGIQLNFAGIAPETDSRLASAGKAVMNTLAVLTGSGTIPAESTEAVDKGAGLGNVARIGSVVASSFLVRVVGATLTFPILIIMGFIKFTGQWLSKIQSTKAVEKFKNNFQKVAEEEIDKKIGERYLDREVNDKIIEAFSNLKRKVQDEVDGILSNTQKTLVELAGKQECQEVITAQQKQTMQEIGDGTRDILLRARELAKRLLVNPDLLLPNTAPSPEVPADTRVCIKS